MPHVLPAHSGRPAPWLLTPGPNSNASLVPRLPQGLEQDLGRTLQGNEDCEALLVPAHEAPEQCGVKGMTQVVGPCAVTARPEGAGPFARNG